MKLSHVLQEALETVQKLINLDNDIIENSSSGADEATTSTISLNESDLVSDLARSLEILTSNLSRRNLFELDDDRVGIVEEDEVEEVNVEDHDDEDHDENPDIECHEDEDDDEDNDDEEDGDDDDDDDDDLDEDDEEEDEEILRDRQRERAEQALNMADKDDNIGGNGDGENLGDARAENPNVDGARQQQLQPKNDTNDETATHSGKSEQYNNDDTVISNSENNDKTTIANQKDEQPTHQQSAPEPKFITLINLADKIMSLILTRKATSTATESCDMFNKLNNFVNLLNLLITLMGENNLMTSSSTTTTSNSTGNTTTTNSQTIFLPLAIGWLQSCRDYMETNQVFTQQQQQLPIQSQQQRPSESNTETSAKNASFNSLQSSSEKTKLILDISCCLLGYLSNILEVLNYLTPISISKQTSDLDAPSSSHQQLQQTQQQQDYQHHPAQTNDAWADDSPSLTNMNDEEEEDDESLVDDSDDESLNNKLCTFTLTQKEFASQHWYHCHTCNMVDRVGVCSVCAKVCHKDHDVTYSKFGAFFCDCAQRDTGNCIALVKRTSSSSGPAANSTSGVNNNPQSLSSRANQSSQGTNNEESKRSAIANDENTDPQSLASDNKSRSLAATSLQGLQSALDSGKIKFASAYQQQCAKSLEPVKDDLLKMLANSNVHKIAMDLLNSLIPAYVRFAYDESHIGRSKRVRVALDELHSTRKVFYTTEALMLPTLGSQEGAFENVRVNYSGEHASQIKSLLSDSSLRRIAMTSLASPFGKRQHLVVCHEKGKITLLQLNALLRQADSSKRKLTLTRLASAPIPFSVISIVANPFIEDVLAVSGLKDCHILTFTHNGLVSSHLELSLDLKPNDYVIKAVWLPGCQTEIAILTSEMVKIYDLSEDASKPKYHLKLAFGSLKDITFIVSDSQATRYILVMDTAGHIFRQELESSASTKFGLFYITNEIQLSQQASIKEVDGKVNGGGVSLYYSHSFKMLFFSFANGNYMASFPKPTEVKQVFPLEFELSTAIPSSNTVSTTSHSASYASVVAAPSAPSASNPDASGIVDPTVSSHEESASSHGETNTSSGTGSSSTPASANTDDASNNSSSSHDANGGSSGAGGGSSSDSNSGPTVTSSPPPTVATLTATQQPTAPSAESMKSNVQEATKPSRSSSQPLCQWSEVPGHVGLIMAVSQQSNNPVIFMLRPDCVFGQEIRYLTVKSKITDATVIRHTTSSGELRTTLILLCEDGSLRIYMASQELTDFWLKLSPNPNLAMGMVPYSSSITSKSSISHPSSEFIVTQDTLTSSGGPAAKRRKITHNKSLRTKSGVQRVQSNPSFPVEFFENLQVLNDIDFGGSDILSVYNTQQIKNRLNSSGMHITCTKTTGFSIDIINNDLNMVICGIRVQVGSQEISKCPSSIEMFGRIIPITPLTSRWYDLPLTREESVQAEKKMTITFGPSADANGITIVDSIRVYGKPKEHFAWPEDGDETGIRTTGVDCDDLFGLFLGNESGSRFQKLLIYSMKSLECCLNMNQLERSQLEPLAKELTKSLLTVPFSSQVSKTIKNLLLTIYSSKQNYAHHRDMAALDFIKSTLTSFDSDYSQIDCELFARVVYIMNSLCRSKASNLTKLYDCYSDDLSSGSKIERLIGNLDSEFWHCYDQKPTNINLSSVAFSGFVNFEETLQHIIEIIHIASLQELSVLSKATPILVGYLLSEDINISLCARHTLIRLLRVKSQRQHLAQQAQKTATSSQQHQQQVSLDVVPSTSFDQTQSVDGQQQAPQQLSTTPDRFESLQSASEQLNPSSLSQSSIASQLRDVLRDHIDANRQENEDDIIAIALSLQDDNSQNNSATDNAVTAAPTISGRSELNLLSDRMASAEEPMSDTTASGVASDEDVSTSGPKSAPIGNQLLPGQLVMDTRADTTSLQEHQTNVNREGSSSMKMIDQDVIEPSTSKPDAVTQIQTQKSNSAAIFEPERMRQQHLMLLERLIEHFPATREAGGIRSISLLHVVLVLTLDLDCENDVDDAILKNLLHGLRQELLWDSEDIESLTQRNAHNEVKLVIMRMFSILMSKVRTSSVASAVSSQTRAETNSCWSMLCSSTTAASLIDSNVVDFCYNVLNSLIPFWKNFAETYPAQLNASEPASCMATTMAPAEPVLPLNRRTLPKSSFNQVKAPDLAPFFLKQQVKGQNFDVFDDYPQLLTEMVLRIPYQIRKVSSSSSNTLRPVNFATEWSTILCEYLMIPIPSYIKKHVRKLLTFICGSKEKYRQLRDFHFLESHMKSVKEICGYGGITSDHDNVITISHEIGIKTVSLSYESMTALVVHLKACIEIAQNRCINWQVYCMLKDQNLLAFLMRISMDYGDDVSPIVLELIQHALSSPQLAATTQSMASLLDTPVLLSTATLDNLINNQTFRDTLTSGSLSANLSQQLITAIPKELLSRFIQSFLLETNLTSLRWQAHSLLYNLWSNFSQPQQSELLWVLWSLWHNLPKYGRKAAQFVDLLGFVTMKSSSNCDEDYDRMFCQEALSVLKQQNQLLINHPNAHIYSSIQGLVDLESYYLESEPCSVCNSPEVPYNNVKLSSIKIDSRFTTTTQIIKLVGSHTILKFSMRISDIKRSKMVKTISIYYNNRSVQSVVELKNKTGIWNLARKQPLSPGQQDVKIEFTLPIIACNLMIEFTEFYENFQASSETLQCPRCSTSVSANPGVCSNCGENVFQCHKCRAINYDEKDPFLCISCGFCKYARFDISLTAKATFAVDPIENEEDRKKTVANISGLLEKADRVYKNLMQNKPTLELLLLRIHEQVMPDRQFDETILGADQSVSHSTSFSGGPHHNNHPSGGLFGGNNVLGHVGGPSGLPPSSGGPSSNHHNHTHHPSNSGLQSQSIIVGYAPPSSSVPSALTSSVNKAIQHLAQKYCVECKGLFEELSKTAHKVLALRKELVEYDNKQLRRCLNAGSSILSSANRRKSRVYSSLSSGSGSCYGCATATVEHCVTMLKALSTIYKLRSQICESGIINELVNYNLKNGSYAVGQEVRQLLCSLTRDDLNSTTTLTDLLMEKIAAISKQDYQPIEISHIVRHEIALLSVTLDSDDKCWELRLRCLIRIFAFAFELKNPTVMECLIIPCLKLLLSIIRPPSPSTRRHKDKSLENIASVRSDNYRGRVLLQEWLRDSNFIFEDWRKRAARPMSVSGRSTLSKQQQQQQQPLIKPPTSTAILSQKSRNSRYAYLAEKYANRWRLKCSKYNKSCQPIASLPNDWLKRLIFNRSSKTVRLMAKSLVESLFAVQSRRKEIIDLLTSYLNEIGPAGECAQEFYYLYKQIIMSDHWRYYLALQGVLVRLGELITLEIDHLQELEETTLNSSLSLGYSLKMLLELLTAFVTMPKIRTHFKSKLVGFVLKGYLSLRKLVVQRTKTIDETQEMLLELLEGMTTGSESETAAFIDVCVEAIKNCHEGDIRTPVFIFERLCSTIHPEESVHNEFFVSLEKDPQQEDFLQGRMLGNPYSSNDPGIGPLMKDIKNKICQDCELLALLEDDSSMELLVANRIICLDLPVRDVYKKIWCVENHENDAMRIVYRMRGLLGDATEEFIESLDSRNNEQIDEEQVYKMANIMSTSGGLEVMLQRLRQIDDLSPPFKPLLDVILKLFNHCSKTKNNRLKLLAPELMTIETLLSTLRIALNEDDFLDAAHLEKDIFMDHTSTNPMITNQSQQQQPISPPTRPLVASQSNPKTQVVDQILAITETILREASRQPRAVFNQFTANASCGRIGDIQFLLNAAQILSCRLPHVSHKIIQVLPFLTLGDKDKMSTLINYFKPSIDFDKFDSEHSALNDTTIDLFCIMVDAIEQNENGNQLKDFIVSEGIVAQSLKYLTSQAPPLKSSLLATSEEWRDFTSKPALKYILRILGGLSKEHSSTQVLISRDCIPIVHGLEQVSSDARVGTLAENLLEAIKQHPSVAEKIELVRKQTKEEKKKLAMAVRERQLGALGMKANERGQVTTKSKLLEQCQDLADDSGMICNICREGYKFQPTKVLGIYTYTKRCVLEEFEMKPRKLYGYTTVTHFNTVHVDCHMSAVRSARSRDEWDSAALQNANTRCNGLLPIWGPQVPESTYASALARHNSYLQDSTGYRDIGYHSTVHDIRLQLLRFAQERSFSEDTGGGGPQSNLHLLPYMMQTALYVLNSTKNATREYKRTLNYLEMSSTEIIENCYEVDSPYYWTALAPLVLPPTWWKKKRVQFLQRLLICNHVRRVNIKPPAPLSDPRVRTYSYYKPALLYFAFIDGFYNIVFKYAIYEERHTHPDWSSALANYLKHQDQTVNDNIEVLLSLYQNSLLTCTSKERFFEIIRLDEITQTPNEFLAETLKSV